MAWLRIPTPTNNQSGVGYSFSNRFGVTSAQTIKGVLWYKNSNSPPPNKIYITQEGNGTPLVTVGPAPVTWADAGAGWWYYDFPTGVSVTSGVQYRIVMYMESVGARQTFISTNLTPDSPLTAGVSHYQTGDHIQPSNQNINNEKYGLSPYIGALPDFSAGTTPDPNAGTFHEMSIWLQAGNPLLRPDSLAKLAYDAILSLRTLVEQAKAWTDLLGPWPSLLTNTWLTATTNFLTDQATWLAKADTQLTGASGGGGSAFYGPNGTQVAAGVEDIIATLGAGPASSLMREWMTLSPDLTDTQRWTVVGTTIGSGDGFVSDGADAYLFSFSTIPPKQPQHVLPGSQLWVPRLSWCAPLRNGYAMQRQFLDFGANLVTAGGLYMGGLLVYAGPGTDWSCDALVLDRP